MILHDKVNISQCEIVKIASIHDTPSPKDIDNLNKFLSGYLQVPSDLKLTEAKPPIEEHVYIKSPSLKNAPPTKSRRTFRNQTNKKTWTPKKNPTKWQDLTKSPNWKKLKKRDKQLLMVGWPNRYFRYSYPELGNIWNCTERHAMRKVKNFQYEGLLTTEHRFLERRGKQTGINKRNYNVLTAVGKERVESLVAFLFPDSSIPSTQKCHPEIAILRMDICQGDSVAAAAANSHAFSYSDEKNEVSLKPEAATIFDMFGFSKRLSLN